ncbi:uncharacterized protein LOC135120073 [Zophobas morio]|uniref:uncharacterized protein LOC135120073 n=1 Tax=Zophobas morio TaxID=2755281 RepID=UPI003083E271
MNFLRKQWLEEWIRKTKLDKEALKLDLERKHKEGVLRVKQMRGPKTHSLQRFTSLATHKKMCEDALIGKNSRFEEQKSFEKRLESENKIKLERLSKVEYITPSNMAAKIEEALLRPRSFDTSFVRVKERKDYSNPFVQLSQKSKIQKRKF